MTQGFSPPRPARGVAGPARPRSPRPQPSSAAGSGGSALCPARPVPPLAAFPRASLSRCFPSPPPLPPSLFPPPSLSPPSSRPAAHSPLGLSGCGAWVSFVGRRGGGRRDSRRAGEWKARGCRRRIGTPHLLPFHPPFFRFPPPPPPPPSFARPPRPGPLPPRVSPIVHHHAPHRALAVWGVAAVVGVLPEAAGAG